MENIFIVLFVSVKEFRVTFLIVNFVFTALVFLNALWLILCFIKNNKNMFKTKKIYAHVQEQFRCTNLFRSSAVSSRDRAWLLQNIYHMQFIKLYRKFVWKSFEIFKSLVSLFNIFFVNGISNRWFQNQQDA